MRMVKVFHATLPVSVRAPARVTGVHVPNRPDTYRTFLQADFHRGVRLYPPFAPLSIRVKSPTFSGGIGGRPTRHARPLRAEAAVVSHPSCAARGAGASGDALRLLRARRDPVYRRAPRALPHARRAPVPQPLDHLTRLTGSEHTPLGGGEPAACDPLHFRERRPEGRQVRLGDRGQELHEHEMGDPLDVVRRRRGQAGKRRRLLLTSEAGLAARHDHDAAPLAGERQAGEQRRHGAVLSLAATLQHEAAVGEGPGPDGGAAGPPHGARQRGHLGRQSLQLGEGPGHREGELRAGAQPCVRGDGTVDDQVRPCTGPGEAVIPGEAARELEGAVGVWAFGRKRGGGGGAGRDEERGRRPRRAHTAEAAAQVAAQVEDAEVEARRRLDEYGARRGHDAAGWGRGAARTYSVSSAIASRSRGPAVLSTMTWSRASSSRIWSDGSSCVRVARIAASMTACFARLKPRNSRRKPRCTTAVTTRERGGVASIARTSSSRHEHAASSTAPRTTAAGSAGNCGLEIAARANSRTSSVRFTTAALVALRFLNVAVSRNGLMTISSSPHSTPMGAKFTRPAAPLVVRVDSEVTRGTQG